MADPTTVGREEHLQWAAAILAALSPEWRLVRVEPCIPGDGCALADHVEATP